MAAADRDPGPGCDRNRDAGDRLRTASDDAAVAKFGGAGRRRCSGRRHDLESERAGAPVANQRRDGAGFIRADALYDPLVNGKTVGQIHGNVTFIPNVGLGINDQTSRVSYQLPQTLTAGEFSILITGIEHQSKGLKTKVMSMSSGYDNRTTNPRRFTIEKRGNTEPGSIAWRIITSGGQIETIGTARRFVKFDPSLSYFWRATWGGGNYLLMIDEGGVGGTGVYQRGSPYLGVYDPNPQVVFLGSPESSSGPDAQSVPGIVLRHVWVSAAPRPAYANRCVTASLRR